MELKVDMPALASQSVDPAAFQRVWDRVMPNQAAPRSDAVPPVNIPDTSPPSPPRRRRRPSPRSSSPLFPTAPLSPTPPAYPTAPRVRIVLRVQTVLHARSVRPVRSASPARPARNVLHAGTVPRVRSARPSAHPARLRRSVSPAPPCAWARAPRGTARCWSS